MGHVGVAGEGAAARTHRGALVGRLDGHNQVGGVGHHHVRHLEDDNKIEHLTPTRRGLEPDPNYLNSRFPIPTNKPYKHSGKKG